MPTPRPHRLLAALGIAIATALFMPNAVAGLAATPDGTDRVVAHAAVRDVNSALVGVLTLVTTRDGRIVITGRLSGLSPGFHGFHIHAVGICDPTAVDPAGNPAPFATAGPHLNPRGAVHGHHAGDLPVLLVTRNGTVRLVTETDMVTRAEIFDADRSAFIIHATTDNYANIPTRYVSTTTNQPGPDAATQATGDSGGRVACGVIQAS